MAKRRNISGKLLRESIPQPKDVAELVAPRTVENGLSIANVFGDVGDMIDPFITAAIEKQQGLRDVSDDELKLLAALGSIPVAGAAATKITKKLNKLVPNPKGGFIRNPNYKKPMTQAQKQATDKAIDQWNKAVAKNPHIAGVQHYPDPVEWESKRLNDVDEFFGKQYNFTPKDLGAFPPKPDPNIVTEAILPEHTKDAAWLRHNPSMSNYDALLQSQKMQLRNDYKTGKIPKADDIEPNPVGGFYPLYYDKRGVLHTTESGLKNKIFNKLEEKFPGYIDAMEGRGPGQKKYLESIDQMQRLYMNDDVLKNRYNSIQNKKELLNSGVVSPDEIPNLEKEIAQEENVFNALIMDRILR